MKNLLFLFIIISLSAHSQTDNLSKEFRNLSWIKDDKCVEIISTISYVYGIDSLKNDTNWATHENYLLHYDSLSLWYITKDSKYYAEKDTNAKSGALKDFSKAKLKMSEYEWLLRYSQDLYEGYRENGNLVEGKHSCVPTSCNNIYLFKKNPSDWKEEKNILTIITKVE